MWPSPTTMFHDDLVRLSFSNDMFVPQRRLKGSVTQISEYDADSTHVITGATSEKNAEKAVWPNAVPGVHHHKYRRFSNGLDDTGKTYYSIIFDKTKAVPNVVYSYIAAEPASLYRTVDLSSPEDHIVLVRLEHRAEQALTYLDNVKIWITVSPVCLPNYELGRVPYDIDVKATYDLYHGYKNSLNENATSVYSPRGWLTEASIVMHPSFNVHIDVSKHFVRSPCGQAWIDSSLRVVNTSQYTYWDPETHRYFVSNKFIGNQTTSIPRCHRRDQGNVCSVIATVRLSYIDCGHPVAFSVSQAVSQIARHTRQGFRTPKPETFDASRRLPIPDHGDMRYDMCEARACEDASVCTPLHVENSQLMHDGDIMIEQRDVIMSGYIETICRFEVIGFMDDIWSPHVYFRQWAGYNYTLL